MVFFTCNACGESLKKAQVDKHVNMCRGCQVLSCIDCGKDFWGDDYKDHVRCISEDQKYGGKGFEAKANKGDVKQQQWLQKIHVALSKPGVGASLQNVLRQVAVYDNVPRKKAKFQNWMKNSLKISNSGLHEQVWDILSAEPVNSAPQPLAEAPPSTEGGDANGDGVEKKKKLNKRERKEARRQQNGANASKKDQDQDQDLVQRKKERKRKHRHDEQNDAENKKAKTEGQSAEDEQEPEEEQASKGKFNWKGNIRALLKDSEEHELSVKKLRKKVLAAFYSFTGDANHKSEEEVLALFNKKIHNNPKFRVLKDRVKLIK
ncbi:cell growth-regulating nucleolar protein [Eucyclogobius newberryi]|uniref:cell growth-regulating nucleolar protein n=1 Tax=Eucyclogobius newberryi TaxID=166745 RepID=UPI003B59E654